MALIPTFVDYVIGHGKTRGNQPAVLLADRVITYAMLAEAILTAEAKIAGLKLPPGSIIGICVGSPIRHLALLGALIRAGHTGLSLYTIGDLASLGIRAACVLTERLEFPSASRQVLADDSWFAPSDRLTKATSRPREESDVLRVEFSSGTTGRPKALDITARLMTSKTNSILFLHAKFAWTRMSSLLDIQSGWGLRIVAAVLSSGSSILLHTSNVDALKIGAVYNIDCLRASVAQVNELVAIQKVDPVPSLGLKAVMLGGSGIGQRQIEEICTYLSPNVILSYASSEAGVIAFTEGHELLTTPRSAGPLVPWVEIRIEDEAGALQPLGVRGVLKIRPFNGFAKPHGVRSPDLERPESEWFTPGDLAILHEGDQLEIVGRIDELINIGGVKRAPDVIDAAIKRHPAVLDCAAFSLPIKGGRRQPRRCDHNDATRQVDRVAELVHRSGHRRSPAFHCERIAPYGHGQDQVPRTCSTLFRSSMSRPRSIFTHTRQVSLKPRHRPPTARRTCPRGPHPAHPWGGSGRR